MAILELKSTVTKMKKLLRRLHSRFAFSEEASLGSVGRGLKKLRLGAENKEAAAAVFQELMLWPGPRRGF